MPQCSFCGRTFARNEHLARHLRIHTGERPFLCPHCGAGFQRPDVLGKHVEKLHPEQAPSTDGRSQRSERASSSKSSKPRDRSRSRLACDQCRKRKLKCDNIRPCTSCQTKLLACTVSSLSRPPGRPRLAAPISPPASQITAEAVAETQHITAAADQTPPVETTPDSVFPPWTAGSEDDSAILPRLPSPDISTVVAIGTPSLGESYHTELGPIGLGLPNVAQWMSPRPPAMPADIPPVPSAFGPHVLHLSPSCDALNLFDGLVPVGDFGSWLDDLRDFSGSDIWPQEAVDFDPDFNPSMEGAIALLQEQLTQQCRSRGSSPSQAAQQRSWYSALPQLSIYDEDIVNVLLNVARRHLSTTFGLFADFEAGPDTRVHLCLAMAAVGGLYCTGIPDSAKVVKMLFNDARRLLLEDYLDAAADSLGFDDALSIAQTFILLEVYGICSGDKRAYEFAEVFHGSKLHAVKCCTEALPRHADGRPAAQRRQTRLLGEASRILDSYRVLLLQLPPSFEDDAADPPSGLAAQPLQHLPDGGLVSTLQHDDPSMFPADTRQLATIIRYSWMASPRGDAAGAAARPLWKTDFVLHMLDRWIRAKTAAPHPRDGRDVPQMLLYHLAQVTLHSNMPVLQRLAQATIHANASPAEDTAGPSEHNAMQPWASKRRFQMAHWHAQQILQMSQDSVFSRSRRRDSLDAERVHGALVEPPHLALCIYFATLVVWFGEARSPWRADGSPHDLSTETGWQLLDKLRVPVAAILAKAILGLAKSKGGTCQALAWR